MTELDREKTTVSPADTMDQSCQEPGTDLQEHGARQPVSVSCPEAKGVPADGEPEENALEKAIEEASENRDRWMRAVAELENYKKRALQEKSKLLKYRNEELLRDLLPIVDNMERALGHCEAEGRCDPMSQGVSMIAGMFREVLGRFGVTEIQALGETFDPYVHEALARIPTEDQPPNKVAEVLEKGYMYQDRLLRPAKVAVTAPCAKEEAEHAE